MLFATCRSLIAGLALALAVAGATPAHARAPTGIRGIVMRSPITPVCIQGVPCSAPAKNTRLVFSRFGRSITTRTDTAGRYRVALAPGSWRVTTGRAPRIGAGISPHLVRMFAGRFRIVKFDIDTGIR
jgi:hypothetical protein